MFAIKCFILCLSLAVLEANPGKVSFIDRCHYTDSKCLKKSAEKAAPYIIKGLPEFGMPSFDPLVIEESVKGDNGDLKLLFKNVTVKNIPKCEIIKVVRSEKLRVEVEIICPISATGEYILGGKLFVLDINGNGDFEIKTDEIRITVSIILKVIEKDGKKYYKFSSFDYTYEALKKVFFTFDNLFNGDKAKAEPVLSILDQSWKELFNEMGKPVVKEIVTHIIKAIGKFFLHVPCDELELD